MEKVYLSRLFILVSLFIFLPSLVFALDQNQDVFYPPEDILQKEMGISTEQYMQLLQTNAEHNRTTSVPNIWGTSPKSGTIHIPVLLIQFTDKPATLSQTDINAAFNDSNYLNGNGISVSRYYAKESYGQLNIIYDVYNWRTATNTYSYYSLNSSRNFQLAIDTINLFNSTNQGPDTNFAQYDNDNDGRIDGFVIIYPGVGGFAPNAVWAQTRILKQYNNNSVDGKFLGNVSMVPEKGIAYTNNFETEVATHEFAHVLGLPDLYNNTPTGSGDGPINGLTMMDFQETDCPNKPINLDAWSRYYLGWTNPIILTTDSNKEISLRSSNDYPDSVILRNSNMTSREFFIIENRHRTADLENLDRCLWNSPDYEDYTYGGFAIYHVDEQKIETDFANNYVQYDSDGNWWNDTVSHPGIFYEQNTPFFLGDKYASTLDLYWNGTVQHPDGGPPYVLTHFDENQYLGGPPDLLMTFDTTTKSYSGITNPLIRFEAISPTNQYTMTAKMLVGEETQTPTATLPSGNYVSGTTIELSTTTPEAVIYYTTDGTTPTQSSTLYTTPITINHNFTLKAIAYKTDHYASDVVTYNYTTGNALQNLILDLQFLNIDSNVTINNDSNIINARVNYGTNITNLTPVITIEEGCSITPSNVPQNFTNPVTYTVTSASGSRVYTVYVIINAPIILPPVASVSGGDYNSPQVVELTSPTPGTTIRYTLDGSEPNRITSLIYQNPITISSSTTLKAKAYLYVGQEVFHSRRIVNNTINLPNMQVKKIQWFASSTTTEYYIISILERQKRTKEPIQETSNLVEITSTETISKIQ